MEIAGRIRSGPSATLFHTVTEETLAKVIPGNLAATRRAALAISNLAYQQM